MPINQRIVSAEMDWKDAKNMKLMDKIKTSWNGVEAEGIIMGLSLSLSKNMVTVTIHYAD